MPWLHRLACFRYVINVFCPILDLIKIQLTDTVHVELFWKKKILISTETMLSSLSFFINDGSTVLTTHESTSMVRRMKVWWRMLVPQRGQRKRPKRQNNSFVYRRAVQRRKEESFARWGDLSQIWKNHRTIVWTGLDCHMHLCAMGLQTRYCFSSLCRLNSSIHAFS